MAILGSLIGVAAALAFVLLAALVVWGVGKAALSELVATNRSRPPTGTERVLALCGVLVPAIGAALLALLGGLRIVQVALGLG